MKVVDELITLAIAPSIDIFQQPTCPFVPLMRTIFSLDSFCRAGCVFWENIRKALIDLYRSDPDELQGLLVVFGLEGERFFRLGVGVFDIDWYCGPVVVGRSSAI